MGKSVNKVILVGRLGRDPELKYTASGTPFCRFSIATDEGWTDKTSGERQERTEWHNIVVWDRLAEMFLLAQASGAAGPSLLWPVSRDRIQWRLWIQQNHREQSQSVFRLLRKFLQTNKHHAIRRIQVSPQVPR